MEGRTQRHVSPTRVGVGQSSVDASPIRVQVWTLTTLTHDCYLSVDMTLTSAAVTMLLGEAHTILYRETHPNQAFFCLPPQRWSLLRHSANAGKRLHPCHVFKVMVRARR